MDQCLVAMGFLVSLALLAVGYYIGISERDSRRLLDPTEHGERPL